MAASTAAATKGAANGEKKAEIRMTNDLSKARDPLTPDEFDYALNYLQTQMRAVATVTPPDVDKDGKKETREAYLDRLRKIVFASSDKPPIIVKLMEDTRDFLLNRLSNIDTDPQHFAVLRENLQRFTNGEITSGEGVGPVFRGVDPVQFRKIQRALLEERLRTDAERKTKLNIAKQ